MDFCGWWSTSCGTGRIYSQAWLGSVASRQAGRQGLHPTTGAGDDIWCTIGTRGKWDYSRGNGIDSLLDRFTDPHRIEYRRKGCKTHHLWGELHTTWNNLFGLGNSTHRPFDLAVPSHSSPPLHPPLLSTPTLVEACRGDSVWLQLWLRDLSVSSVSWLFLSLWSISCLRWNNSTLY